MLALPASLDVEPGGDLAGFDEVRVQIEPDEPLGQVLSDSPEHLLLFPLRWPIRVPPFVLLGAPDLLHHVVHSHDQESARAARGIEDQVRWRRR